MSEGFSVLASIVYSDLEEIDEETKCELHTVESAADAAAEQVRKRIIDSIPHDKLCSIVIGDRKEIGV